MDKYKRIALLGVAILLCFLVACQRKEPEQVSITIIHSWGGREADHVAMREIYEGFQKQNPNIQVQFIAMPTRDEMLRKVEDMIMVGDVPDVVNFSGMGQNETYDFMVDNDMALNLTPYLEKDKDLAQSISDVNLEYWKNDKGELFNVADALSLSGGYWYNQKIFASAGIKEMPQTWEEFLEMCRKIQSWSKRENADIKPLGVSAEGYLYFLDHILADSGKASKKSVEDSQILVEDSEMEQMFLRLKEIYAYSVSEEEKYSYRDETDLFNEGKIALYVNGVWGAPMISEEIDAGYALLPTMSGKSISCEAACMGYVLGNSGNEEKEQAAVLFLKYMLSEEVQTRILEKTEQIPANPNVALEDFKQQKPRLYEAAEVVLHAEQKINLPDNLWSSSQKSGFTENILEVLGEERSEEELLKRMK